MAVVLQVIGVFLEGPSLAGYFHRQFPIGPMIYLVGSAILGSGFISEKL